MKVLTLSLLLLLLAPIFLGSAGRDLIIPPRQQIVDVARAEGIPTRHLLAIWGVESSQSTYVHISGTSGEVGGFQIMPATARWLKCSVDWQGSLTTQARCASRVYKFAQKRCGNSFMRNVRHYNRPGNGCGWRVKPNRHQMRAMAWLDIERRRSVREWRQQEGIRA